VTKWRLSATAAQSEKMRRWLGESWHSLASMQWRSRREIAGVEGGVLGWRNAWPYKSALAA
jgi:hypothetical protein